VTFSIFSCFLRIQPVVLKPPDKVVILSGAEGTLALLTTETGQKDLLRYAIAG